MSDLRKTPLEHYREAEVLLYRANNGYGIGASAKELLIREAQVHATLANAHRTAGVWGET